VGFPCQSCWVRPLPTYRVGLVVCFLLLQEGEASSGWTSDLFTVSHLSVAVTKYLRKSTFKKKGSL
jgi:hypothetical protein